MQTNSVDLIIFVIRLLFHLGIIVSIWRYNDDSARWRPGVGSMAAILAGINAAAIFTAIRDVYWNPYELHSDFMTTACIGFLWLAVIQVKGNIAIFVRPIQDAFKYIAKVFHHG